MRYLVTITKTAQVEVEADDADMAVAMASELEGQAFVEFGMTIVAEPVVAGVVDD